MESTHSTKLNEMQLFMIKQFDRPLAPEQQIEIKKMLSDYFARLVDEEIDRIWDERGLTSCPSQAGR
ncbi:dephospho-CoA kinase [Spirosoma sp. HMF3257]|uniref:Dephospho-CoA kinase n=1 Tax=Spirosoma telluris TaxID=2183553 RepID=A0A327NR47_9BACT|nr:dephospho-CoA kinase [Spirosoma telluris]RAI77205.1 dephospho-CoA kinase [Spirosoma telluris]